MYPAIAVYHTVVPLPVHGIPVFGQSNATKVDNGVVTCACPRADVGEPTRCTITVIVVPTIITIMSPRDVRSGW